MKSLPVQLAIIVGCFTSFTAAAELSPPTVDQPLYGCATMVSVKGFVPGATIEIFADGATRIGGGVSDSPWGQAFPVNPPLSVGRVITATQTFDRATSGPSSAVTVESYERVSSRLPQPLIDAPLYACGGALGVRNLAKGGLLRVFAKGNRIGQVDGCGEGQWVRNSPLFSTGQVVTADEMLCTATGPISAPVVVSPTPATLPPVSVGDIYEGGKFCSIEGITNGALVTTLNGASVLDSDHYPGGSSGQIIRLTPPPAAGDTITSSQALCATTSPPSVPVTVQPCSSLPPPSLAPICPGDSKVGVTSVLGSRVQVYADGVLVGDGGGDVINFFGAAAEAGQTYTAKQTLGTCVSQMSSPLAVGCRLPQQIPAEIGGAGGRAVAVAVDPTDSNNIVVASETGGLFRSTEKGVYWSHVSGATNFFFSDVTYLAGSPNVVIATAKRDTRTVSGGGIWRSTDGGTTWKKPPVAYPTVDCTNNVSASGLAVEPESGRVWAATSCGLAFSDNAGASFNYLPPGTGYNYDPTFAVVAPDKMRLVILTGAGVLVSRDSGGTFTNSLTGIPAGASGTTHNQIAVPAGNKDHIYWAFNYSELDATTNNWEGHNALYGSVNFGSSWSKLIDNKGIGSREPFVRLSESLAGEASMYQAYYGDGACSLQRASVNVDAAATVSAWTSLNFDHCDPSDLAFDNDKRTPLLLTSDGGLHRTADSGSNWKLAGGGPYGYNALQITEVTGQLQKSGPVHLYFSTQDNQIWASPNAGASWPTSRCCEGFFLNIPRDYYPPDQTRLTGVSCAGCGNFISEPQLANQNNFPNPPNDAGNPRLLKPGYYIHNTADPANAGSTFVLTTNNGANWNTRYFFSEAVQDLSQISGPTNDPVIYTPKQSAGTTTDNQSVMQLKRISGVLGSGTPLVSDVTGIQTMGVFGTMFAWYKVFGVDPQNANYLMVPDRLGAVVRVSQDGGGSWTDDTLLTSNVTQGGQFQFDIKPVFIQVTTIGVDPDCEGHILVGTQQAGIFVTYNSGKTWGRFAGTEVIPLVSRFFYKGGGEVIVSSYGRGLWRLTDTCLSKRQDLKLPRPRRLQWPFLFWEGARIPLNQLTPQACEKCAFILARGGRITDVAITPKKELQSLSINRGGLAAYRLDGRELKVPVNVRRLNRAGSFTRVPGLAQVLADGDEVKGLFVEGTTLRGVVVAANDVTVAQLPRTQPVGARLTAQPDKSGGRIEIGSGPIQITGHGFDGRYSLEALVDGRPLSLGRELQWQTDDSFVLWVPPTLGLGGHTVVVRQRTDKGVLEAATTFLITVSDREEKERRPKQ